MGKKIGLISCHEVYNYGSQLMSLALQMMIEKLNLECEHIQYFSKHDRYYYKWFLFKLINKALWLHKKELKRKEKSIVNDNKLIKKMKDKRIFFDNFKKTYMNFSKKVEGYSSLKKLAENYSCIILGSDQVWHPMNLEGNFKNMEFVPENVPKIVYGASFGVTAIPWYQKKRTKHYLNRIKYISTREIQGAKIIKELINLDIPVVLDPTLMITKEEWNSKLNFKYNIKDKYIFAYFLGDNEEYRKQVKFLKEKTGLKVIAIDSYLMKDVNYIDIRADEVGPDEFVGLIKNAEYICTDSFHGSVFSILNEKKFITFMRYKKSIKTSANSRIESLFNQLNLLDRIYNDKDLYLQIIKPIDYIEINNLLNILRKQSGEYLIRALKGCDIL